MGSTVTEYPGKEALASTVMRCSTKAFQAQTGLRTFSRQHKQWTQQSEPYQEIMRGLNHSVKTADHNKVLVGPWWLTHLALCTYAGSSAELVPISNACVASFVMAASGLPMPALT